MCGSVRHWAVSVVVKDTTCISVQFTQPKPCKDNISVITKVIWEIKFFAMCNVIYISKDLVLPE